MGTRANTRGGWCPRAEVRRFGYADFVRGKAFVIALLLMGCDGGDEEGGTEAGTTSSSTSGQSDGSSGAAETSSGASSQPDPTTDPSAGATTSPDPTTDPSAGQDDSSSGEPLPEGPGCSVQVTTHGALTDPLPRGDIEGAFPPVIADALEDWCGCHTLENNSQNVEHEGLTAPGGTLFLDYADMSRPSGGGTLAQALAQAIEDYSMPPGSCSFPSDAQTLLEDWFAQGAPDGATYVPM